jgi:hypothetical protein
MWGQKGGLEPVAKRQNEVQIRSYFGIRKERRWLTYAYPAPWLRGNKNSSIPKTGLRGRGEILDRCGNCCFYILQINGALLAFGIEMTMV